jgi:hypothetical protein
MNNMNECCGAAPGVIKTSKPVNPTQNTGDMIQNIREITNDIEEQSNIIRAKIKGTVPRPCNPSESPEPCVINYLEMIREQLREIRDTLSETNISI